MAESSYTFKVSGNNNDSNLVISSNSGSIIDGDHHDHIIHKELGELEQKFTELSDSLQSNNALDLLQQAGIDANELGVSTNVSRLDLHEALVTKNISDISDLSNSLQANNSEDLLQQAGIDANELGVSTNVSRLDLHEALVTKNIKDITELNVNKDALIKPSDEIVKLLGTIPNTLSSSGNTYSPVYVKSKAGKDLAIYALGSGLICYDSTNKVVLWDKTRTLGNGPRDLFSEESIMPWYNKLVAETQENPFNITALLKGDSPPSSYIGLRNTPVVDEVNNLVFVNNSQYIAAPFIIAGFDLDSGERKYCMDMRKDYLQEGKFYGNSFNPYNVTGNLTIKNRAGLILDHDLEGNICLYYGTTILSDYNWKNLFGKEDRSELGSFGQIGEFVKVKIIDSTNCEEVWKVKTQPNEVLPIPGQKIPDTCFRIDTSFSILQVRALEGLAFDNSDVVVYRDASENENRVPMFIPIKDAEGNFDQSQKWWVQFPETGVLTLDASYQAVLEDENKNLSDVSNVFSGAELIGADETFEGLVSIPVLVNKNFVFGENELSYWIAYKSNTYGGSVWQQLRPAFTSSDEGEFISFAVGNGTKIADDEQYILDKNILNLQEGFRRYLKGEWTLDQVKENAIQNQTPLNLSPRSNRSCIDSIVTVNKHTGKLHNINKSINNDAWDMAVLGGYFGFFDPANGTFGQPNNKPYLFPYGPDGDASAPVVLNDGKIAAGTKAGYVIIDKASQPSLLTKADSNDDNNMGNGIFIQKSTTQKKLYTGFGGTLGGINYGISTDGEKIFVNNANVITWPSVAEVLETFSSKGWVTLDGREIPIGTSYTTCISSDGDILWEKENGRTGFSTISTVYKDVILHYGNKSSSGDEKEFINIMNKHNGEQLYEIDVASSRLRVGPLVVNDTIYYNNRDLLVLMSLPSLDTFKLIALKNKINKNSSDIERVPVLIDEDLPTLQELGETCKFDYGNFLPSKDEQGNNYTPNFLKTSSFFSIPENIENLSIPITHNAHLYNPPKFSVTVISNNKVGTANIMEKMRAHYTKSADFLSKNELPLNPVTMGVTKESKKNMKYNGIYYTELDYNESVDATYIPSPPVPTPGVYVFDLYDSWGDGWNGATMTITDENEELLYEFAFPNGSYKQETIPEPPNGAIRNIRVSSGAWPSEISWTLKDPSGIEVLRGGAPYEKLNIEFPFYGVFDDSPILLPFANPVKEQPENINVNADWLQFVFRQPSLAGWTVRGLLYLRNIDNDYGYFGHSLYKSGVVLFKMIRIKSIEDFKEDGKLRFLYDEKTHEVNIYGKNITYSHITNIDDDTFDPSNSNYNETISKLGKQEIINNLYKNLEVLENIRMTIVGVKNVNGVLKKCHINECEYAVQSDKIEITTWLNKVYLYEGLDNSNNFIYNLDRPLDSYPAQTGGYVFSPSPRFRQGETIYGPDLESPNNPEVPYVVNAYYSKDIVNTWRGLQFVPFNYKAEGSVNVVNPVHGTGFNAWATYGLSNSGVSNPQLGLDTRFGQVTCFNSNFFSGLIPCALIGQKTDEDYEPNCVSSFDSFNTMVAGHEYSHTLQQGIQGAWMNFDDNPNLNIVDDHEHNHGCCFVHKDILGRLNRRNKKTNKLTDGIFGVENMATFMEKMRDYSPNVGGGIRTRAPYWTAQRILDGTFLWDYNTLLPSYNAICHTAWLEDNIHDDNNNNVDGTCKREYLKYQFNFTKDKRPLASKNGKVVTNNPDTIANISNKLIEYSHEDAFVGNTGLLMSSLKDIFGYTSYDFMNQAYLYAGKNNSDKISLKHQVLEIATSLSMCYNKHQRQDIPDKYKFSNNTIVFDLDFNKNLAALSDEEYTHQVKLYLQNVLPNFPERAFIDATFEELTEIAKSNGVTLFGATTNNDITNFRASKTLKSWPSETKLGSGLKPGKDIVENTLETAYTCNSFSALGLNKFSYHLDASGEIWRDESGNIKAEVNVNEFSIQVVNNDENGNPLNEDPSGNYMLRLFAFNKKLDNTKLLELQTDAVDVPFVENDVSLTLNGPPVTIDIYNLLNIDSETDKDDYNVNIIFANLSENSQVKLLFSNVTYSDLFL